MKKALNRFLEFIVFLAMIFIVVYITLYFISIIIQLFKF